jgi:MYXO-CTERM domain-containing protein
MSLLRRASFLATLTAAALAPLALPSTAAACGGTFCDTGPKSQNVDQKGENILFVGDGQSVEAHIQIQYDGHDMARFAWVLPLQSMPTSIGVGSQQLFTNLLAGSVPSYGYTTVNDCPSCGSGTGAGKGGGAGSGGSGSAGAGGSGGGGPVVTFQATVGAFDVVVLQGGTADEVMTWLGNNQYQQIPAAKPILEDYLSKGYLFLAAKMTNGANIDEIHPLVVTYPGDKPCIPLKLTAIAATQDMGVRAFFLGAGRWVPSNYKLMVPNDATVDWMAFGANYTKVISNAADAPVNDGHAFATEYAGTSNVVTQAGIYSSGWNSSPFVGIDPTKVVSTLSSQGLMQCFGSSQCNFNHPLVQGLLHEFLPVPTGMTDAAFYSCLSCNQAKIDLTKWDAAKFAKALEDRIIAPGKRAAQILQQNKYLTRLFTTISPAEMTEDPEFHERADLPSVTTKNNLAQRRQKCGGVSGMDLPDGREIALSNGNWPIWGPSMPWVERIEDVSGPVGTPPVVLVDNKTQIDAQIVAWNTAQSWPPPPPPGCGTGGSGSGGKSGGSSTGGKSGGSSVGGAAGKGGVGQGAGGVTGSGATSSGTGGVSSTGQGGSGTAAGAPGSVGGAPANQDEFSGGGGCSVPGAGPGGAIGLGWIALALAAARRRKKD